MKNFLILFLLFLIIIININSLQVQTISNFFDKNIFSFNDNIFNVINIAKEAVEEVSTNGKDSNERKQEKILRKNLSDNAKNLFKNVKNNINNFEIDKTKIEGGKKKDNSILLKLYSNEMNNQLKEVNNQLDNCKNEIADLIYTLYELKNATIYFNNKK